MSATAKAPYFRVGQYVRLGKGDGYCGTILSVHLDRSTVTVDFGEINSSYEVPREHMQYLVAVGGHNPYDLDPIK